MEYLSEECAAQSVGPGNQIIGLLIQTLLSSYCAISPSTLWPEDYGIKALKDGLPKYDFIVIGAGSAGAVIANRLSENPNWKVLLLEAGGNPPIESEVPNLYFTVQRTSHDWQYQTEPNGKSCLAMKNGVCYWPRGKVLGGSSGINCMLYVKGNRKDYDDWKNMGNPSWGWDDVMKYFKKSQNLKANITDKRDQLYNKGGPLTVDQFLSDVKISEVIMKAAEELGYKNVTDFNEDSYLGYNNVMGTTHKGRRFSTAKAYLIPAKNRSNLHIVKHAHVKKIEIDTNKIVTGVTFVYKSLHEMTAKVTKEVIVSAGAIGSPQLLMLSGIGPANHLKQLGIPLIKNLAVGDNLQDHLIVPIVFNVNKSSAKAVDKEELLDSIYNYLMNRTSPLSHHYTMNLVGFINTMDPKAPYPDIEFHHFFFRKQSPETKYYVKAAGFSEVLEQSILKINREADTLVAYVVLLKPVSTGKIRLASTNYLDKPKIFANYLDRDEDMETLLRGLKYQIKFEDTKAFQESEAILIRVPLESCDNVEYKSDDYWKCYINHLSTTVYHPTSTVKMGPDTDPTAVVDHRLKVKGVQGLRVGDASIMPTIVSANTNGPTIMIGEKLADMIKEDWKTEWEKRSEL